MRNLCHTVVLSGHEFQFYFLCCYYVINTYHVFAILIINLKIVAHFDIWLPCVCVSACACARACACACACACVCVCVPPHVNGTDPLSPPRGRVSAGRQQGGPSPGYGRFCEAAAAGPPEEAAAAPRS